MSYITTTVFSIIAVVAFLGNLLVIYVFASKSSYLKKPYNIFIFNLAVTDFLTAILLVFSRYIYLPPMPEGESSQLIYCRTISSARILFMVGYISLYTCLALTIERWFAVVKPLMYRSVVKARHAVIVTAVVWTWGLVINFSSFFRYNVKHGKQTRCVSAQLSVADKELFWLDFILQTVIPFALIVTLYIHILCTLSKLPNVNTVNNRTLKKVTFVALAASSVLIVGWMPGRIRLILIRSGFIAFNTNSPVQYSFATMALSNCSINPFLYGIYGARFREEYKAVFKKIFCGWKSRDASGVRNASVIIVNQAVISMQERRTVRSHRSKLQTEC